MIDMTPLFIAESYLNEARKEAEDLREQLLDTQKLLLRITSERDTLQQRLIGVEKGAE